MRPSVKEITYLICIDITDNLYRLTQYLWYVMWQWVNSISDESLSIDQSPCFDRQKIYHQYPEAWYQIWSNPDCVLYSSPFSGISYIPLPNGWPREAHKCCEKQLPSVMIMIIPNSIAQLRIPICFWYSWTPFSSNSAEVSISGFKIDGYERIPSPYYDRIFQSAVRVLYIYSIAALQ